MNIEEERLYRKKNKTNIISYLKERDTVSLDEICNYYDYSKVYGKKILDSLIKENKIIENNNNYQLNPSAQRTLCIAIFRNSLRIHLVYRVYDYKKTIETEKDIIKKYLSIEDFYDIIDTTLANYDNVEAIGISIPGIIVDGYVTSTSVSNFDNINMHHLLKKKYTQRIVIENDVNSAALGFYIDSSEYDNVAILFQPVAANAGIGIVTNGHLLRGKTHIAGEVQYLPTIYSQPFEELLKAPQGFEELLSKQLQTLIAMINPDAVGIYCSAIFDYTNIIHILKKVFNSANDLPILVKIDSLYDYILIGLNELCLDKVHDSYIY